MNIHARLLGLCDALMLGLMGAVQLGVLIATFDVMTTPPTQLRASVEIRQLDMPVRG